MCELYWFEERDNKTFIKLFGNQLNWIKKRWISKDLNKWFKYIMRRKRIKTFF